MLPLDGKSNFTSSSVDLKAGTRAEAPRNAALELVFEGISYPCKDGTIIGTSSGFAKSAFSKVDGLEPRHLLLGIEDGYWFALTPKSVQQPFRLEGKQLVRGERTILDKARYHVEFDNVRFGLRLSPRRATRIANSR
jgi:hypothetical protein